MRCHQRRSRCGVYGFGAMTNRVPVKLSSDYDPRHYRFSRERARYSPELERTKPLMPWIAVFCWALAVFTVVLVIVVQFI